MPITSYTDLLDGASLYEGQIANLESAIVRTGINADTTNNIIVFGRAVVKGTGDKDLLLPVDANSVFQGIAVATDVFEKRPSYSLNSDNDFGYPLQYVMSYLIRGVIGVKVESNVNPTSPVFWIHTPSSGRKGQFRADANTAKAVQITNARFLKTGLVGNVVPLSINLA
jgi:hypothetical protein